MAKRRCLKRNKPTRKGAKGKCTRWAKSRTAGKKTTTRRRRKASSGKCSVVGRRRICRDTKGRIKSNRPAGAKRRKRRKS